MGAIFTLIGVAGGTALFAWGVLGVFSPRAAKLESRGEAVARIAMAIFVVFVWTSLGKWVDSGLRNEIESASSADVAAKRPPEQAGNDGEINDITAKDLEGNDEKTNRNSDPSFSTAKIEGAIQDGDADLAHKLIEQAMASGLLPEEAHATFLSQVTDLRVASAIEKYRLTRNDDSLLAIRSLRDALGRHGKELPFASAATKDQLESIVRSLPASRFEENELGYQALLFFDPNNQFYLNKVKTYRERAAAAKKAEREQKVARATKNLVKSHDKVQGVTWYKHKRQPRYTDTRSYILPYIGRKGNIEWIRVRINYTANKWLFVNDVVLYVDGETYDLTLPQFERDNDTEIWEWVDVEGDRMRKYLDMIARSKEAILRFNGDQYYKDVTIPMADKRAIAEVLEAYDLMRAGHI